MGPNTKRRARTYCRAIPQRGVALITVLLVLALATVTVVSMSSERQLDIRRTENLLRGDQLWLWVQSLESVASERLMDDDQAMWRKPLKVGEIGGAGLQAGLEEQQGKLNLNNLIVDGEVSEVDVLRFKRLLAQLELKQDLVDAILDWLDEDSVIRYPLGAEDEAYSQKRPPHRAGNGQFADVSELLLVQGVSGRDYEILRPFIYAVPGYAALNVNTASATILRCLADDISADRAESMFRASGKPFKDVAEFFKDEAVANLGISRQGLTVNSEYFLMAGMVNMGKLRLQFASHLKRHANGQITVLRRARTEWQHG